MISVFGFTFSDQPFMTAPERGEFKRLIAAGALPVFDIAICCADECENEVLKGKLFCSPQCYQKEEGHDDEEEGEEENRDGDW